MATLNELIAQKAELDRQISEAQRASKEDALARVREIMTEAGLSLADLSQRKKDTASSAKTAGKKVAAKYRNKETGEAWSGRGLKPKWLKAAIEGGKKIEDFAV
jgi:DNA-binding protein H-NS